MGNVTPCDLCGKAAGATVHVTGHMWRQGNQWLPMGDPRAALAEKDERIKELEAALREARPRVYHDPGRGGGPSHLFSKKCLRCRIEDALERSKKP